MSRDPRPPTAARPASTRRPLDFEARLDEAQVRRGVRASERALAMREGDISLLVDFREMTGYDTRTRYVFMRWQRETGVHPAATAIVPPRLLWQTVDTDVDPLTRRRMRALDSLEAVDAWLGIAVEAPPSALAPAAAIDEAGGKAKPDGSIPSTSPTTTSGRLGVEVRFRGLSTIPVVKKLAARSEMLDGRSSRLDSTASTGSFPTTPTPCLGTDWRRWRAHCGDTQPRWRRSTTRKILGSSLAGRSFDGREGRAWVGRCTWKGRVR